MGTEVGGSIGELCSQGCSKGSNDINKLALHNKTSQIYMWPKCISEGPPPHYELPFSEQII
jgi:hypothetical protein